jgi:hypothetical protein
MPNFGIEKDRSATAVTKPFAEENSGGVKSLPRFWIDIAVSGGIMWEPPSKALGRFRNQEDFVGSGASYNFCSSRMARDGHSTMLIYEQI